MFQLKNIQICKSPFGVLIAIADRGAYPFCFSTLLRLINAQTILINGIPRDTSYTVYSSFIKEKRIFHLSNWWTQSRMI